MWLTARNGTEWEGDERGKWHFHTDRENNPISFQSSVHNSPCLYPILFLVVMVITDQALGSPSLRAHPSCRCGTQKQEEDPRTTHHLLPCISDPTGESRRRGPQPPSPTSDHDMGMDIDDPVDYDRPADAPDSERDRHSQ
jgi:hypothetical protein